MALTYKRESKEKFPSSNNLFQTEKIRKEEEEAEEKEHDVINETTTTDNDLINVADEPLEQDHHFES